MTSARYIENTGRMGVKSRWCGKWQVASAGNTTRKSHLFEGKTANKRKKKKVVYSGEWMFCAKKVSLQLDLTYLPWHLDVAFYELLNQKNYHLL